MFYSSNAWTYRKAKGKCTKQLKNQPINADIMCDSFLWDILEEPNILDAEISKYYMQYSADSKIILFVVSQKPYPVFAKDRRKMDLNIDCESSCFSYQDTNKAFISYGCFRIHREFLFDALNVIRKLNAHHAFVIFTKNSASDMDLFEKFQSTVEDGDINYNKVMRTFCVEGNSVAVFKDTSDGSSLNRYYRNKFLP